MLQLCWNTIKFKLPNWHFALLLAFCKWGQTNLVSIVTSMRSFYIYEMKLGNTNSGFWSLGYRYTMCSWYMEKYITWYVTYAGSVIWRTESVSVMTQELWGFNRFIHRPTNVIINIVQTWKSHFITLWMSQVRKMVLMDVKLSWYYICWTMFKYVSTDGNGFCNACCKDSAVSVPQTFVVKSEIIVATPVVVVIVCLFAIEYV